MLLNIVGVIGIINSFFNVTDMTCVLTGSKSRWLLLCSATFALVLFTAMGVCMLVYQCIAIVCHDLNVALNRR